ncbi:GCN5-related N-acetyltransferase [Rubrobacter xylanophilus DSM 9941]|uniref:GCN5-related N-acetyltransferase n=1 Tax=Rubrobacter xylanophilus (strain DSM 9941 / JCM 11954 / NBRC 16129 / PRD-1) TaxID=266117 RepID=Q1AYF9_RUBXD|nr:GNAT family N-acetyltransferase [Rubrobacter xylanophilus]ABG03569.1 GCN5-related N-acetyltransferase [Rubrobacter xylanophilus DSM 9941]
MRELRTRRLRLRPFERKDLAALARIASEEETRGFLCDGERGPGEVREALEGWLESYREGFGQLAMILQEGGRLIGHCGLERRGERAVLSYALHKDHWCRGLAPEACREVLRYGFEELGLEEVWTATRPENRAWRGMMERLGMGLREEGPGEVRYAVSRGAFLRRPAAAGA